MKRDNTRAILITTEGKICLVFRRKNGLEYYVTPGGGIDDGETPIQAVIRELEEEVGAKLTEADCTLAQKFVGEKGTAYFFICRETKPREKFTGDEMKNTDPDNFYKIVEVEKSEINELNLMPEYIKDYILANDF